MQNSSRFRHRQARTRILISIFCSLLTAQAATSPPSQQQAAAIERFARNFPYTFHFGGRLKGSIVSSVSDIGFCRLTTSQADPQKADRPDVSQLDFDEYFWLQIAVQEDGTKSRVLAVQGVEGQTASKRVATYYFDTSQKAQNFTSDLVILVRACGGTAEIKTAILPALLLSPP